MGFLPQCNSTLEDRAIDEQPVWHTYTFHRIGLWLSAIFGLVAIAVSFFLIMMHATRYSKPLEQKHIIRILLMVPIYAAVSFLSYLYYRQTVYFEVLRDCYEAFAIAAFFSLICHYIAPTIHTQKNHFRGLQPKDWVWPIPWFRKIRGGQRLWRRPRTGLTWFNIIWTGVYQYCFIRVFMTCVAVGTQAFDRYCLESLNPAFAHVWVMTIEAAAVTVAMYCLIQFYYEVRGDIAQHQPLLKIAAIKLVIFLSFWQTMLISFLTSTGAIKPSNKFQTPDIKVGIPAMLLCIEMAIFAVFHLWAFSYKPYVLPSKTSMMESMQNSESMTLSYRGGPLGLLALLDAFNLWDMIKAVGRSARWLFKGRKHRKDDPSYNIQGIGPNGSAPGQYSSTGPKSSTTGDHAAYTGAGLNPAPRPSHYSGGESGEVESLLSNPQDDPISHSERPKMSRPPPAGEGDIGFAKTTDDDYDGEWSGPNDKSFAARVSAEQRFREQETGITAAPGSDPRRSGQSWPSSAAAAAPAPHYAIASEDARSASRPLPGQTQAQNPGRPTRRQ